jgi:hypothetical protein
MDCDAPTMTAGNHASAANAAQAQAQLAPVQQLAKSVGLLGSLDLLGALTAAGASGDFGSYMLDAGTGMEQDVAAFAVSVFFGRAKASSFFFFQPPLFLGESKLLKPFSCPFSPSTCNLTGHRDARPRVQAQGEASSVEARTGE